MIVTSPNVANAITKLVAVDALPSIFEEMVIGNLIARDFEPTLAQHLDTVKVNDTLVVMDKCIEATFQIPDITKVLAVPDLLSLYMRPATNAIAAEVDTAIMGLRFSELGERLSDAAIDAIDVALFRAGVSASTPKYLVTDVGGYSQLRIPRFSEYQTARDAGISVLVEGPVGKIEPTIHVLIDVSLANVAKTEKTALADDFTEAHASEEECRDFCAARKEAMNTPVNFFPVAISEEDLPSKDTRDA